MAQKTVTKRIAEALTSTVQKPEPKDVLPVGKEEKVLGRVSPAGQALFALVDEIREERFAAKRKLTGTDACAVSCPCKRLESEAMFVHNILAFVVGEEMGNVAGAYEIRADWQVVGVKPRTSADFGDFQDDLPSGLTDLLKKAFGGDGVEVVVMGDPRRKAQEV